MLDHNGYPAFRFNGYPPKSVTVASLLYSSFHSVLQIRIRMDPELLPGSGIVVPDLDPAKYVKQINKNVISL